MKFEKINLDEKFNLFSDYWNPRLIAELNGQHVKLAKIKGEFVWHKHDTEDELFYVLKGQLKMQYRDRTELLNEGEMIVVPKGVEHKPVADEEVHILLFEPASTINTGSTESDLTRDNIQSI